MKANSVSPINYLIAKQIVQLQGTGTTNFGLHRVKVDGKAIQTGQEPLTMAVNVSAKNGRDVDHALITLTDIRNNPVIQLASLPPSSDPAALRTTISTWGSSESITYYDDEHQPIGSDRPLLCCLDNLYSLNDPTRQNRYHLELDLTYANERFEAAFTSQIRDDRKIKIGGDFTQYKGAIEVATVAHALAVPDVSRNNSILQAHGISLIDPNFLGVDEFLKDDGKSTHILVDLGIEEGTQVREGRVQFVDSTGRPLIHLVPDDKTVIHLYQSVGRFASVVPYYTVQGLRSETDSTGNNYYDVEIIGYSGFLRVKTEPHTIDSSGIYTQAPRPYYGGLIAIGPFEKSA